MKFPEEMIKIVKDANANNPSKPEDATAAALLGITRMSSYDDLVVMLVEQAVKNLIFDERHLINVRIKYQAGAYNTKTKTVVGDSSAVMRAEISAYLYNVAGTSLGEVLGKDLLDIADIEDNRAEGHVFNSRLLRRLSDVVPDDKKVKNAITDKKLKALFSELQAVPGRKQAAASDPNVDKVLAGA